MNCAICGLGHQTSECIQAAGYGRDTVDTVHADRDKWWIEKIDAMFEGNKPYFCFNEEFPPCENCKPSAIKLCPFYQWQTLKQEIGQ